MARSAHPAGTFPLRDALAGLAAAVGQAAEWVLGLMLLAVVAINVVNASGRYLFSYRLVGADELMVYTVIYVVMGGAVLALARREHISINLVPSYARGRLRSAIHAVHDLAALVAAVLAAVASWDYVGKIAGFGTRSMALGITMTIPHAAILAGFVAMAAVALALLARDLMELAAPGARP